MTGFTGMHTARNQGYDDQIPDGVDLEVDPKAALPTRLRLRPAVAELPTLHAIRAWVGELEIWSVISKQYANVIAGRVRTETSSEHDMAVPIVHVEYGERPTALLAVGYGLVCCGTRRKTDRVQTVQVIL